MILPITKNLRIASDHRQWIIQRLRTRKRNDRIVPEWRSESFFPTFDGAVRELGESMVRESGAEGFTEGLIAIENVCAKLCEALPSQIRVTTESGEFPERKQP